MSAFLTSLASIGSQYGEATNEARLEKEARATKLHQMDVEDAYLQLAKQADERQRQLTEQQLKLGKYLKIGNRYWDVEKSAWLSPPPTDPLANFRKLTSTLDPKIKAGAEGRVQAILEADPEAYDKALTEGFRYIDKADEDTRKANERADEYVQKLSDKRADAEKTRQERMADRKLMMQFALGLAAQKPTSDEWKRADLAENVDENLDTIEDIVRRRPELFGTFHGTLTALRGKIGTSDEDIASLEQVKDNLGRALQGAHGMRAASGVANAANSVLNSFRNGDKATLAAVARARASVETFRNDVLMKLRGNPAGGLGNQPAVNNADPLSVLPLLQGGPR